MSALGLLPRERLLEVYEAKGAQMASVSPEALALPVPTVAGWTVEDVIRHTGKVHRRVLAYLTAPIDADPGEVARSVADLSPGPACLPEYRDAHAALGRRLAALDLDAPVATFTGPQPGGFWARRQAHELAVHLVDVDDALRESHGGDSASFEEDVAVDGVEEWLDVFLPLWQRRAGRLPEDLDARSIHLHGTDPSTPGPDGSDLAAEWLISVSDGAAVVSKGHAKGDVAVRGSAPDLLLVLWRRRPLTAVDLVGDAAVFDRLVDLIRI